MSGIEDKMESDLEAAVIEFEQRMALLSQPKLYRVLDLLYNNPAFLATSMLITALTAINVIATVAAYLGLFSNHVINLLKSEVLFLGILCFYTTLFVVFGIHYDNWSDKVNSNH